MTHHRTPCLFLALAAILSSADAVALEEAVRREAVDAGVHVPVLTKEPTLLTQVEAVYPEHAREEGKVADVRLLVTVDAEGRVADVVVPNPVGDGFDEAAAAALRQFVFTPAEVDGAPASVQIEYVYRFTLSVREPSAPDAGAPPPRATLSGQLLSRGSRSRVPSATVQCKGGEAEAVSDEDGRFELRVPAGECRAIVVALGFHVFETIERLEADQRTEVNYYLIPRSVGFETVVRGVREKKEVVRRTLERQELQRIPGSFGDPVRVLQNFPGVARAPFISGALIVRGASPEDTATFLDGVEIPLLYHLGGGPSVINGEFLQRIDFYPGGFSSRYGRALGGVVDVATRTGASDTLHGVVKIDLQDSSVFLETPLAPGVSAAGAVRRSYIDALLPLVLPRDPEQGAIAIVPQYWDYQVRVDSGPPKGEKGTSSLSVMAFGSDDVLKVAATGSGLNRELSIDTHTLFHRLVARWSQRTERATYTLTPHLGYDLAAASFGITKLDIDQYAAGLRQDLSLDLSDRLTLRAGLDARYEHLVGRAELPVITGTQTVEFPGEEPSAERQEVRRVIDSIDGALYGELDVALGPLTVTPGVRATHAFLHGETRRSIEPRLWTRLRVLPKTTVKGSVGLYTQPPAASELEPAPFGNQALDYASALQTSVGVEHAFSDVISIDATAYYSRRFDLVVSPGRTIINDDGSVTNERLSNDGLGRAFGLELLLRHDVTREFFGWIAYTLNRAEERRRGSDEGYRVTSFDQTHILTLVGSYRLPLGFEAGARFRYVTGRPKTPLLHPYDDYDVDADRFYATRGEPRSARLAPFSQLDVRIDKSWLFDRWTFTLFLDVQNVLNTQNVEASFTDYRQREEFSVPGIPILPILGARGSF